MKLYHSFVCLWCRCPVAVPGVRLAVGAAALHTDRGHSLGSLHLPPAALPSLPGLSPAVRVLRHNKKRDTRMGISLFGAADRTRTGTSVTSRDFKSLVSTYSTTAAYILLYAPAAHGAAVLLRYLTTVPGVYLFPRLRYPASSSPISRLPHLPTAAHAYALLHLPPVAQSNAATAA